MTKCYQNPIRFSSVQRRKVKATFSGGAITGNGGIPLLAEVDRQLGLTHSVSKYLGMHNGIRSVNFAIRLRIRSWALVIRWFFIPLAGCRCRCFPSSLPLSDRFSGSPFTGPARTEPLPTPDDLADHTSHGFPEGGCLLK